MKSFVFFKHLIKTKMKQHMLIDVGSETISGPSCSAIAKMGDYFSTKLYNLYPVYIASVKSKT